MFDTTGLNPRDAKIIRENDGKTPYELLQLGLSQKAYERLTKPSEGKSKLIVQADAPAPKQPATEPKAAPAPPAPKQSDTLTPDVVETTKKAPAQPKLGRTATAIAAQSALKGQVTVVGPTGIPQRMAEKQARKLVASNPTRYKII